ncbi:cysteine-rich with EGF-like domain protein 2-B [Cimex lectularius]|uniref:EGF-like domain-containing protein n=1 Tax=Cimex lectularius TaxID=79782 RepID=A0A8I6S5N2_CIMLE|nr:cysteine-rich with EGF-like domain protein 2-B [Cimex lectularius]
MDRTNKKHFGGGDAAWEAEKLGNYAHSEVRLMEVLEHLCSDVVKGQSQCYRLVEEWEEAIEKWWFNKKPGILHDWLCINETKSCCPVDHFGLQCTPCPGYPDVCTNNGKCNGSGTREGNGKCICSCRYTGANCDKCADNFYEDRSDNYLFCLECDKACKGCTGARRENCIECNNGWEKNKNGCVDINECKLKGTCKNNEHCVNKDGHFECLPCDKSCNRCHGIGPDMCDKCTTGYRLHYGVFEELIQKSSCLLQPKQVYCGTAVAYSHNLESAHFPWCLSGGSGRLGVFR